MTVFAADANTSEIDETPYRQVSGQEIADYAMYIATILRPNYQLGHIAYNKNTFREDSLDCLQFVFASLMGAFGEQRWDNYDNPSVIGLNTVWWYAYNHKTTDPYSAVSMGNLANNTKLNPRYGHNWVDWLQQYVGKEIYIDGYNEYGEHIRQYYVVGVAGTFDECNAQLANADMIYRIGDVQIGGKYYSSYLAYAQSFPGSIIWCNGHASIGVGFYETRDLLQQYYDSLGYDINAYTRANNQNTSITVAPQTYYYNYMYPRTNDPYDALYYLGRTWQVSASGQTVGVRMVNGTTDAGNAENRKRDQFVVLIPVQTQERFYNEEVLETNQYTPRIGWNATVLQEVMKLNQD